MSTQRTPPNNLPKPLSAQTKRDNSTQRSKRKQPEDSPGSPNAPSNQVLAWPKKMDETIMESVAEAVKLCLSAELEKISTSLIEINTAMRDLQADNASIKEWMHNVNTRLSDMEISLNAMDQRQDMLDQRIITLEKNCTSQSDVSDQITGLENKINYFDQQTRECNVEICNLPERRNENLLAIVTNLGMAINHKLTPSDIVSVHRVPHFSRDVRPKNIIVKFTSKIIRDNILAACRLKKGLNSEQLLLSGAVQTIYVNEHLTVKNKLLFRECRQKAKSQNFKYVWVKHGIVLVRRTDNSPVLAIRSMHDIAKIKP